MSGTVLWLRRKEIYKRDLIALKMKRDDTAGQELR